MQTVDKQTWAYVLSRLSEPFPVDEVKFKPQKVLQGKGTAIAVAFVDARIVADRLNAVVGPENWEDSYEPIVVTEYDSKKDAHIQYGGMKCTLTILGVTKSDVGSPSMADELKGSASDALKRAAVKFGVGRYMYDLGSMFLKYDEQKRQFTEKPKLPDFAVPEPTQSPDEAIFELFYEATGNVSGENIIAAAAIMREFHPNSSLVQKRDIYKRLSALVPNESE